MLLLLLTALAFAFPLAVYCLLLAALNRSRHPVMVSGVWDFSEVLLACSGFLIFGGPCVLTGFDPYWRNYWLHGEFWALRGRSFEWWRFWLLVGVVYVAVILGLAGFLLWKRRLATPIYNIEPTLLPNILGDVLDRQGRKWMRSGNHVVIEPPALDAEGLQESQEKLVLELTASPALHHVTLHWPADAGPLRDEIESELEKALTQVPSAANPLGAWLISIAGVLFSTMFFILAYLIIVFLRTRHGI